MLHRIRQCDFDATVGPVDVILCPEEQVDSTRGSSTPTSGTVVAS